MKIKIILRVVICGISLGFIYGLIKAIQIISSQKYIHYKLHNSTLSTLSGNINRGAAYGLITVIFVYLFIKTISFAWQKLFRPFFKVKIIKKRELTPLIKGIFFGFILIYLTLQIINYVKNPVHDIKFIFSQSLIVSFLLFLTLRIETIKALLLKPKILSFFKSAAPKMTAGATLCLFLLLNVITIGQRLFNHPSGPNVLLIVPDALRADHLGCYGYNRPTSPHIDKFAADALVFERAMSNAPWTLPSMGSIFTSLHPHEHRAYYWTDSLPDDCLTLAEVFRDKKYTTFSIQTNVCVSKTYNFDQGFQYFEEPFLEKAEKVAAQFNAWVKKNKNKPFFAYLHFMDTHLHYDTSDEFIDIFEPEGINSPITGHHHGFIIRALDLIGLTPEDKKHMINLYDAEIRYFDYSFGMIVENLKKLGLFDNTIIVLMADHGEEFWDHGGFEHGHALYDEVVHVPLIIKYSSKLPVKRIKQYVQLLDFFPTILSLTGIKNSFDLKGKDLIPFILNDKPIDEEIFFEGITYGAEKKAVLKNGWKLIENTGIKSDRSSDPLGDLIQGRNLEYKQGYELYNAEQDFQDKINLINDYPQIANNLKAHLRLFKIAPVGYYKQKMTNLEKKKKDLKSLGYLR